MRLTALLTALALVAVSCGAIGSDSPADQDPSPGVASDGSNVESESGDSSSAPVDGSDTSPTIEFTLEEDASVTATIGAEGGELATESNGVQYRLIVPADALLEPVEITMTPVADAQSGLVDLTMGGVEFAPSGLLMGRAALLEISGVAVPSELMAVHWTESGGTVTEALVTSPESELVQIPVAHFSGAGAGTPGSGGSGSTPSSKSDRARKTIGDALKGAGNDFTCIESNSPEAVTALKYYKEAGVEEVIPALKQAQANDMVLVSAVRQLLRWWELPEIFDIVLCNAEPFFSVRDDHSREMGARARAALTHAIYEAGRQCHARKDPGEVKNILSWWSRGLLLLPIISGDPNDLRMDAQKVIETCVTFRVELRAQFTLDANDAGQFRGTVAAVATDVQEADAGALLLGTTDYSFPFGEPTYHLELPPDSNQCSYENRASLEPIQGKALELRYPPPQRKIPGLSYGGEDSTEGKSKIDGDKEQPKSDGLVLIEEIKATGSIVIHCDGTTRTVPFMHELVAKWFNKMSKSDYWQSLAYPLEKGDGNPFAFFRSTEPLVDPTDPTSQVEQETDVKVFHTPKNPGADPPPPPGAED